jgi:hypothetical protein
MATTSFTYQLASDVIRDGLALELLDANGVVAAEVFRSDANHSVQLETFQGNLPASAIQDLVTAAIRRLDPFEDGRPLETATNYGALLELSGGRSNTALERTREE